LCWTAGAVGQEARIDPDADTILKSMSDFMGKLKAFSVDYDIDTEVVDRTGQKLGFSSSGQLVLERPGKLHATRQGAVANAEIFFDGKTLSLYGKNLNAYLQRDVQGTIDDAIEFVRGDLSLDAPGADLLASDIYSGLMSDTEEGAYIGVASLSGKKAHHLAYRTDQVDWQIWVQADGDPLPLKYVITSKWITGAPEYSVRLFNWNASPKLEGAKFTFAPPADAKKLETITTNPMGEIATEGE
jgi:hypothetical protein